MISDRQCDILFRTIRAFVETAEPVSSLHLADQVHASPATIRNELAELTHLGFLAQPHVSAGRVPTDKGYRLFVNEALKGAESEALKTEDNPFEMARRLAELSSSLILSCFPKERLSLKEGWEHLMTQPEFASQNSIFELISFLHDLEPGIERNTRVPFSIFIGEENPFSSVHSFSVIMAPWREGTVALVGPVRMVYERNIALMRALTI